MRSRGAARECHVDAEAVRHLFVHMNVEIAPRPATSPDDLTTNERLKEWGHVLHEDPVQAIIDRVLERAACCAWMASIAPCT